MPLNGPRYPFADPPPPRSWFDTALMAVTLLLGLGMVARALWFTVLG